MTQENDCKSDNTIVRVSINGFVNRFDITKTKLAKALRLSRFQIANWERGKHVHKIDYCRQTGEVRVVVPERLVKKCVMDEIREKRDQKS